VAKYTGQYIAVVGKKIVAHGYDFEKVYEKAKKYGENPLFDKVPDTEIVVYGRNPISRRYSLDEQMFLIFLKSLSTKPIA